MPRNPGALMCFCVLPLCRSPSIPAKKPLNTDICGRVGDVPRFVLVVAR